MPTLLRLFRGRDLPRQCLVAGAVFSLGLALAAQQPAAGQGWPTYGGDPGGSRYSAAAQITRENVGRLQPVWVFHTHALDQPRTGFAEASFEATPLLLGRVLYVSTPFDAIFALDATTGSELWSYDPHVRLEHDVNIVTSRGVALWPLGATAPDATHPCATRVLLGTIDARLLALDAATGKPCAEFGMHGEVDLRQGVRFTASGGYGMTSPPTVLGDVVVVGSSIADNRRVDVESGVVRGYDVRSGRLLWSWEPLPWAAKQSPRTGAGNAWSTIAADPALGLVFVPTGSASPDFYGAYRPGDDRDADSVVALEARTGRKVWAFQTVHHNLWDYDVAAEPLLFTFRAHTPQAAPAVAVATKSGQVFVLDRRNGAPLYPVEERPVPQSTVPGERTSPTQPFSSLPTLAPLSLPTQTPVGWHRSAANEAFCQRQLAGAHQDGIYTPPSTQPTLLYPGSLGGVNWGSLAFDPGSGILYANNNRAPFVVQLIRRHSSAVVWHRAMEWMLDYPFWLGLAAVLYVVLCLRRRRLFPGRGGMAAVLAVAALASLCLVPIGSNDPHFGAEFSAQLGSPYVLSRHPLIDKDGNPCSAPPWAALTALNLNSGAKAWQSTLGTDAAGEPTGSLSLGGPMVTAGGLVFTAATLDAHLRAFDAASGAELWSAPLPAPAQATPMSFTLDGRQFVVIAAGGHAGMDRPRNDALIAFALKP